MKTRTATLAVTITGRPDGFWDLLVRTSAAPDGELYSQMTWYELVDAMMGATYLEVKPELGGRPL